MINQGGKTIGWRVYLIGIAAIKREGYFGVEVLDE